MFLSYAVDPDNNWIHISDVQFSGRTHDLYCPFCRNPLMAKKGKVLIHHFAHEANQSCREWASLANYISPEEGYYGVDLSPAQQRLLREISEQYGAAPFDAEGWRRPTLDALAAKRFLDLFEAPYISHGFLYPRMTSVARLTPRAKAFTHQLTLAQYAQFAEAEHQRTIRELSQQAEHQLARTMLQVEYQRWQDAHLYLVEIETDHRTLLKIGITTRPLAQRLQEIKTFLRQHFLHVEAHPLFYVPGVPYLEGYFKSKFAEHQFAIDNATEYFRPFAQAHQELEELQQLIAAGIATPAPQQPKPDLQRPRFRAMFWRQYEQRNDFTGRYDKFILFVDITNLETLARHADWQSFAPGKQFAALDPLTAGDVIEFNAAITDDGLKRPTKITKATSA